MNGSVDIIQNYVPRKFYLEDANKFAKTLVNADEVFVGFIEAVNETEECHFTHRTAYSDILETLVNKESEALLDEMQVCYPDIFMEPKYPITQNRVPFSISLIDEQLPPPKHKLYPLSEPDLKKVCEKLKVLVDSSRIVPLANPYGALQYLQLRKGMLIFRCVWTTVV